MGGKRMIRRWGILLILLILPMTFARSTALPHEVVSFTPYRTDFEINLGSMHYDQQIRCATKEAYFTSLLDALYSYLYTAGDLQKKGGTCSGCPLLDGLPELLNTLSSVMEELVSCQQTANACQQVHQFSSQVKMFNAMYVGKIIAKLPPNLGRIKMVLAQDPVYQFSKTVAPFLSSAEELLCS